MGKNKTRIGGYLKNRYPVLAACFLLLPVGLPAQSQQTEQLLLDIQKLKALEQVVTDMKQGFTMLKSGYDSIRDLSNQSFLLHQGYLNSLLVPSQRVLQYPKVAGIIADQEAIVKEYQSAYPVLSEDPDFSPGELGYLGSVYNQVLNRSDQALDELTRVITPDSLRMGDGQRLNSIDRIYGTVNDQLDFLKSFNQQALVLALQRARERNDYTTLQSLYGLGTQ